jgi:broad specificity phosphatase PhoE
MRHGEADWPLVNDRRLRGAANDLVPLTPTGITQVARQADRLAGHAIRYVVSSPMTRALQSAGIAARRLSVEVRVEFDLHEWVPDLTYLWTDPGQVDRALAAMRAGVPPEAFDGAPFEHQDDLRARVGAALDRHVAAGPVLVVTHGVVIWSVTGRRIKPAEHVWWTPQAVPR